MTNKSKLSSGALAKYLLCINLRYASLPVTLLLAITFSIFSPAYSAQIDIPLDTWVARSLPGAGNAPAGGMKHQRVAYNPENGRLYYLGGDYAGTEFGASGRNEVYSYSVEFDEWIEEQPYCRPDMGHQPAGPDQVGWTYDSTRNVFWMFPGYMTRTSITNCSDSDNVIIGRIMSFDPVTNTWSLEERTNSTGGPSIKKFGHYDPVNDTFFRFAWMGYPRMEIYDIDADSWQYITFGSEFDRAYLGYGYSAMDEVDRVVYLTSGDEGKLLKYDMDSTVLSYIADLPTGPVNREGNMPVWDSVNRVLMWAVGGSGTPTVFYVYHPTEDRWEHRPINQPEGYTVKGNVAGFDPVQNVMVLMGGYEPSNPYVFLYRYADGDGAPPPPPVADTTSPEVLSANTNSGGTEISILFSERVNQADAETVANYAINDITVTQATLATDQRTLTLTVSAMSDGAQYQVSINNIRDLAENPNTIADNTTISVTFTAPGGNTSTTTPSDYQWDTLTIGKRLYIDRAYTFSDIPDALIGLEYLRTRNDDKSQSANPFVSFAIDTPKAVFVAYDTRIDPLPVWLQSWQPTSFEINGTDYPLRLYRKDFDAGTVNLGANEFGQSMYVVVLGDVDIDTDNTTDNGNTTDPNTPPEEGNPASETADNTDQNDSGGAADWFFVLMLFSTMLTAACRKRKLVQS
jgi:hypothetical protein